MTKLKWGVLCLFGAVVCSVLCPPAGAALKDALWSKLVPRPSGAGEYFVAVNGKANNSGSERAPWDLASVAAGRQKIQPGSVVWVRGGSYIFPVRDSKEGGNGFAVSLSGAEGRPVHLRGWPGERATIDGGFNVAASHLWIWDLEFALADDWRPKEPAPEGPNARFKTPTGVLNISAKTDIKIINCISHNNHMGVGFWKYVSQGEIHGSVIYDNGFPGADRPHGPALYTQNESGTVRLVTDNIIGGNFSLPLQCYGSQIDKQVNDFTIEGNIEIAPRREASGRCYNHLGGNASRNMILRNNFFYGYQVHLSTQSNAASESNIVVRGDYAGPTPEKNIQIGDPASSRAPLAILRPNKYDPRRANLVVSNWERSDRVKADLKGFLKPGDRYRILSPFDFYGKPLAEGSYDGRPVSLPLPSVSWELMTGDHREVGVYIVMKGQGDSTLMR